MEDPKRMDVPYAAAVYGDREVEAALHVLKNPKKIVAGDAVRSFEKHISALFGKEHGVMVNSGSSANLIAFELLNLPAGSEVITPALTFSTTIAPIIQKGLVPVLVDVVPGTYLIDIDQIESHITPKTKALMIPSLLGNIPDMERLQALAKKHNLFFIEDSCDTLGGTFQGKPTGAYSDISTTSFYASHIITAMGGGGMLSFHSREWAERARVTAYWGRASTLFGSHEASEDISRRFAGRIDGEVYDAKFIFQEVGYNMQPTDMQGAFGLVQLDRLQDFSEKRKANVQSLYTFFEQYADVFILPKQDPRVTTNWLCFPLTIRDHAPFSRSDITRYLEEQHIQTRPIFTGNVVRQPAFASLGQRGRSFPVADMIMRQGFVVGCHQGLEPAQLAYLKQTIADFLDARGIRPQEKTPPPSNHPNTSLPDPSNQPSGRIVDSKEKNGYPPYIPTHSSAAFKQILITGGYGFMGSNFIRHLYHAYPHYRIFNVDLLTYAGNQENLTDIEQRESNLDTAMKRYHFIYGDICDSRFLDIIFRRHQFDMVVNFAAETHVDRSIIDMQDFIRTNIGGVRSIIEAVRKYDVARFLHISTDEIYGDMLDGVATEESPLHPSNPYSSSKAAADLIVQSFIRTHKVPAMIARGCNNYGPYQYPEKLIPLAISNILEGKKIPIHGSGNQTRTWVHVFDFCEAIDRILHEAPVYSIYNVANEVKQNVDILEIIATHLDVKLDDYKEHIADRPGGDARYAPNADKLRRELGWTPRLDFKESIGHVVQWYLDHRVWWEKIKRKKEYQDHYQKQSTGQWY